MKKYRAKLPFYALILAFITLLSGGLLVVFSLNNVTKILLFTLFLLFFLALSSLISIFMLVIIPRLERYFAKKRRRKKHPD